MEASHFRRGMQNLSLGGMQTEGQGHLECEQSDDQAPIGEPPGLCEVNQRGGRGQGADAVRKDQAGEGACVTWAQHVTRKASMTEHGEQCNACQGTR